MGCGLYDPLVYYAAATALVDEAVVRPEDRAAAGPWAEAWHRWSSAAFLRAYLERTAGASFLRPRKLHPHARDPARRPRLIELGFELANPSAATVVVPLAAIAELGGV